VQCSWQHWLHLNACYQFAALLLVLGGPFLGLLVWWYVGSGAFGISGGCIGVVASGGTLRGAGVGGMVSGGTLRSVTRFLSLGVPVLCIFSLCMAVWWRIAVICFSASMLVLVDSASEAPIAGHWSARRMSCVTLAIMSCAEMVGIGAVVGSHVSVSPMHSHVVLVIHVQ